MIAGLTLFVASEMERANQAPVPADWPWYVAALAFPTAGAAAGLILAHAKFEGASSRVRDYVRWTLALSSALALLGGVDAIVLRSLRTIPLWCTLGVLAGLGTAATVRFLREDQ